MLLDLENLPPPASEKNLLTCGVEKKDVKKLYLLPSKATKEKKK